MKVVKRIVVFLLAAALVAALPLHASIPRRPFPALSVEHCALNVVRSYDLLGRATNIVERAGAVSRVFSYAYEPAGLATQRVIQLGMYRTDIACRYDALGRLTNETVKARSNPAVTNFYAYDAAGNRTYASTGRWSCVYGYADNRLVSISTNGAPATPVLYDGAGNVTSYVARSGARMSLRWNSLGQLVSVSTNGVLAESYAYDPLGRRASTKTGASLMFHAYNGDRCVADLDGSGKPLRAYSWGPGTDTLRALTVYPSGTGSTNVYYASCDAQGSVGFLTSSGGTSAECYEYDAWGCVAISGLNYGGRRSAPLYGNRFLFHGGDYSQSTGLYQFRARWYAPELGRWLSPDPIGLEGGLNLYEFCGNDPVNFRDPYGLDWAPPIKENGYYDGDLTAQNYERYLRRDYNRVTHDLYTINSDDLYIWSTDDHKDLKRFYGEAFEFRGELYAGDQQGNINAAYAFTRVYGPVTASLVCLFAEIKFMDFHESIPPLWKKAEGSFSMNAIGIKHALLDNFLDWFGSEFRCLDSHQSYP